jgi:LPXTG-site transpeptidase (sortase) family protein
MALAFVMADDTSTNPSKEKKHSASNVPDSRDKQNTVDLIRDKLDRLYDNEPSSEDEITEVENTDKLSKHQKFMYDLSMSGKDLAAIQTEWHSYYQTLSDKEKHQVWKEFYASQSKLVHPNKAEHEISDSFKLSEHRQKNIHAVPKKAPSAKKINKASSVKQTISHKVTAGGRLGLKHQIQSLLFGLGIGFIVIFIFMFGFFNEVLISPFIQPSKVHTNIPLIVDSSTIAPTSDPEVIIPKINVEIPAVYSETSTNEATIENDLQNGVVHYPTTVLPGQLGNAAFFGHSSNNIFNQGKYKFAFVLLHTLQQDDTFYLTYNSKIYAYKVISRQIVDPSDVGVLGPVSGQAATATLITCDPPGTSLHRLVVIGQQISPDPATDTQSSTQTTATSLPNQLPGNGQTLWGRFVSSSIGKLITVFVIIGAVIYLARYFYQKATKLLA